MKNLKNLLAAKSLTYEEFAAALNEKIGYDVIAIGSARSTISQWIAGYRNPSKMKKKMIADYFGISIEELTKEKETEHPENPITE